RIWHMRPESAASECCVDVLRVEPGNDERARRWGRIATQPGGICGADRHWQPVAAAENLHSTLFAVVRGDNAEACALRRRECVADFSDGFYERVPALFFAEVFTVGQCERLQRPPRCNRDKHARSVRPEREDTCPENDGDGSVIDRTQQRRPVHDGDCAESDHYW